MVLHIIALHHCMSLRKGEERNTVLPLFLNSAPKIFSFQRFGIIFFPLWRNSFSFGHLLLHFGQPKCSTRLPVTFEVVIDDGFYLIISSERLGYHLNRLVLHEVLITIGDCSTPHDRRHAHCKGTLLSIISRAKLLYRVHYYAFLRQIGGSTILSYIKSERNTSGLNVGIVRTNSLTSSRQGDGLRYIRIWQLHLES